MFVDWNMCTHIIFWLYFNVLSVGNGIRHFEKSNIIFAVVESHLLFEGWNYMYEQLLPNNTIHDTTLLTVLCLNMVLDMAIILIDVSIRLRFILRYAFDFMLFFMLRFNVQYWFTKTNLDVTKFQLYFYDRLIRHGGVYDLTTRQKIPTHSIKPVCMPTESTNLQYSVYFLTFLFYILSNIKCARNEIGKKPGTQISKLPCILRNSLLYHGNQIAIQRVCQSIHTFHLPWHMCCEAVSLIPQYLIIIY